MNFRYPFLLFFVLLSVSCKVASEDESDSVFLKILNETGNDYNDVEIKMQFLYRYPTTRDGKEYHLEDYTIEIGNLEYGETTEYLLLPDTLFERLSDFRIKVYGIDSDNDPEFRRQIASNDYTFKTDSSVLGSPGEYLYTIRHLPDSSLDSRLYIDNEKIDPLNTYIRILNDTESDFDSVIVYNIQPEAKDIKFLNILSHEYSEYEIGTGVYSTPILQVITEGRVFSITVIDYVGESPIPSGYYTYSISFYNTIRIESEITKE